jgi:hypothetical protein
MRTIRSHVDRQELVGYLFRTPEHLHFVRPAREIFDRHFDRNEQYAVIEPLSGVVVGVYTGLSFAGDLYELPLYHVHLLRTLLGSSRQKRASRLRTKNRIRRRGPNTAPANLTVG